MEYEASFTFRMPGEVVSSTLPEVDGASTSIAYDTGDAESIERLIEAMGEDFVVVAEPGALALASLPLDSQELQVGVDMHSPMGASSYAQVPVTDAEDFFEAEALSAMTISTHVFDEGWDQLTPMQHMQLDYRVENRTTVQARLYAPQGRYVLAVENPRVTEAVDDQGRAIGAPDAGGHTSYHSSSSMQDGPSRSYDFQLTLGLPEPDAEAIEEVVGELTAITFSGYREQRLEQPTAGNVIALDDVVEGAELTIEAVEDQGEHGGRFRLKLTGPAEVANLQLDIEVDNAHFASAFPNRDTNREQDGQTEREVHLQYHYAAREGEAGTLRLVIRLPEDIKRERVEFDLFAIDLF